MKVFRPLEFLWQKNVEFWTRLVPHAWDALPLDGKLAWMMIVTYTICVLTLIEILLLK